jgi:hypothetical protein
MKDNVTVDGVVLTRAQIEAAVRELDAEPVERKLVLGIEGFQQEFSDGETYYYFPLSPTKIREWAKSLMADCVPGISIEPDGRICLCENLTSTPATTALRSQYRIIRIASLNVTEVTE